MQDEKKKKVDQSLSVCHGQYLHHYCSQCPYPMDIPTCVYNLHRDARDVLKRSFTPQEVYYTVIEHGQHDKRFKLGDKIDYSFTDVVDILNIELMCKAGDM